MQVHRTRIGAVVVALARLVAHGLGALARHAHDALVERAVVYHRQVNLGAEAHTVVHILAELKAAVHIAGRNQLARLLILHHRPLCHGNHTAALQLIALGVEKREGRRLLRRNRKSSGNKRKNKSK